MVRETNETELKLETHKICIIIGDDDNWLLSVHVTYMSYKRGRERDELELGNGIRIGRRFSFDQFRVGRRGMATGGWGTRGRGSREWGGTTKGRGGTTKGRGRTTGEWSTREWGTRWWGSRGQGSRGRGNNSIRSVRYIADCEWTIENRVNDYVGNECRDLETVRPLDDVGVHARWSCQGDLEYLNFGHPDEGLPRVNFATADESVLEVGTIYPVALGVVRDLIYYHSCRSDVAVTVVFDGDAERNLFSDAVAGPGQLQCGGDGARSATEKTGRFSDSHCDGQSQLRSVDIDNLTDSKLCFDGMVGLWVAPIYVTTESVSYERRFSLVIRGGSMWWKQESKLKVILTRW